MRAHYNHLDPFLKAEDAETMLRLAEKVIDLTGSTSKIIHLPLPQDDPTRRKPDITLARETLNWQPSVRLSDGLARTIDYFERLLRSKNVIAGRESESKLTIASSQ